MTPEAFCAWLDAVKASGLARSDAGAGRLLGISANSVLDMKKRGTDRRTALACRAIMWNLAPWG